MKKLLTLIMMIMVLSGCSMIEETYKEPPAMKIETKGGTFDVVLGTYCWSVESTFSETKSECVDKVGPVELVENESAIPVEKNEKIKFIVNEDIQPTTFALTRIFDTKEKEIAIDEEMVFLAPSEAGQYTYGFTGKWSEDEDQKVSGDAQYVFKLEVK